MLNFVPLSQTTRQVWLNMLEGTLKLLLMLPRMPLPLSTLLLLPQMVLLPSHLEPERMDSTVRLASFSISSRRN